MNRLRETQEKGRPMFDEPTLRQGDQGRHVRLLQACLKEHFQQNPFPPFKDPGAVDGVFGPKTKAAVVGFQSNFGGPTDGVVGPLTYSQLDDYEFRFPFSMDLNKGATGNPVRRLQRLLYAVDSNPGAIDGIYGDNTAAAVRDFQKKEGLAQDGQAAGQTRMLLSFVF
jgi:peptidoglycan hydrolase-like protein with peptidoglycan-binding domain